MDSLKDRVEKFQGKNILVIGDVMLDGWIRGNVKRISPENQVPIVEFDGTIQYSVGGAANVAANISSLGGQACLFGFIGKDNEGKILSNLLDEQKVEHFFDTNSITSYKLRIEGQSTPIARLDREDSHPKHFENYFKLVGTHNQKHLKRYEKIVVL